MKRLLERAEAEIVVRKSRFIAIAIPISSLEQVKDIVKGVWKEHEGATHVVHAAVAGPSGTMYSCSDDREPKNTAGRPALEVLKGSGITDIVVCIVRYFGGTLLGTGGLVKAYGDSVKEVLKVVRCEQIVPRSTFSILTGYRKHRRRPEGRLREDLRRHHDGTLLPALALAQAEAATLVLQRRSLRILRILT